ncbi:MAG TPA: GtrA family protein [Candidatus Dormibacteraeota bacterium]|nr:GtrA family protein [Candidatus Dormibacteraeota bacterium]
MKKEVLGRRMRWWPGFPTLFRFGVASGISTVVTLTTLGVLVATRVLDETVANVGATLLGTAVAYELNRRWVWGREPRERAVRDLMIFLGLSMAGLVLSTVGVYLVGHFALGRHTPTIARTLALQATNLSAFAALTGLKFMVSESMFRTHPTSAEV